MLICRCPRCMCDLSGYERDVPPICGYGMDESWAEYKHGLCPLCGFDIEGTEQPAEALPRNTILHGKYLIGNVLGQGGFGITYIGFDLSLEIKVAIKEYYPAGAASRREGQSSLVWNRSNMSQTFRQSAYDDFLKEARKMAKMDQIPSIVRVRETFLENETAYIVMDYIEGETLKTRLKRDGVMKFADCIALLRPMMEDLNKVHAQGLIHRDISPDNIMIQPDGKVKLLDLGAAKDLTLQKEGVSQLVTKKGFSPFEQYMDEGEIGPWTDVYALSATIYYACFGKLISSAPKRMEQDDLAFDLPGIDALPKNATEALRKGLAVRVNERTQSVEQLLTELEDLSGETPAEGSADDITVEASAETNSTKDKVKEITKEGGEQNSNTVSGLEKNDAEKKTDYSREDKLEHSITPAPRRFPKWMIPTVAAVLVCAVATGIYALGMGSDSGEIPTEQNTTLISSEATSEAASSEVASEAASSTAVLSAVTQVEDFQYKDNIGNGLYSGQVVDGVPSGKGKIVYDNGAVYDGEWVNGMKSGQGTITFAENDSIDRVSYTGSWKDDQWDGYGTMTWKSGAIYEGEWSQNGFNGQGTMTYPTGDVYVGNWVDSKRSGQGTLTYANGNYYKGEWADNKKNGYGIYYWAEEKWAGYRYEGQWVDDKRNGQGIEYKPDGSINRQGEWVDNDCIG